MNARDKEIREKAWALVSDEERERNELYETRERWERCDQKFAELIVRECANIVEGFTIEQEVALDDYEEYEASDVLKEHFGVKE